MNSKLSLETLVEHRDLILLAEIGALIHDLGKLSEKKGINRVQARPALRLRSGQALPFDYAQDRHYALPSCDDQEGQALGLCQEPLSVSSSTIAPQAALLRHRQESGFLFAGESTHGDHS